MNGPSPRKWLRGPKWLRKCLRENNQNRSSHHRNAESFFKPSLLFPFALHFVLVFGHFGFRKDWTLWFSRPGANPETLKMKTMRAKQNINIEEVTIPSSQTATRSADLVRNPTLHSDEQACGHNDHQNHQDYQEVNTTKTISTAQSPKTLSNSKLVQKTDSQFHWHLCHLTNSNYVTECFCLLFILNSDLANPANLMKCNHNS